MKIIGDTFQSTLKESEALMKKKKRIAMVKELFPDKADIMKMATSSTERRNQWLLAANQNPDVI